jgi:hypothetical protein
MISQIMRLNSTVVLHADCRSGVDRLPPALDPGALAPYTIVRSSIDLEFALVTSDSVRTSSRLVGRTGEIATLAQRGAQMSNLPWWWCAMLAGLCLYWMDKGTARFVSRSPAEYPSLGWNIVAVSPRYCRRTSTASVVVGRKDAGPKDCSLGDHTTLLSSCSL